MSQAGSQGAQEPLPPVNLVGPQTRLGGAPVAPPVAEAVAAMLQRSVVMEELLAACEQRLAEAFEADAATVCHCSAAAIAIASAAVMTGADPGRVERLPDDAGPRRDIVLMAAHDVHYGASVSQMIRLAGARPVRVGTADRCGLYQVEAALGEGTAALLFTASGLVAATALPPLASIVHLARRHGLPLIVDAASMPAPARLLDAGADLVIVSAQKELGAPTAGILLGRPDLIAACRLQQIGIGRAMKPTKEALAGIMAALGRPPRTPAMDPAIAAQRLSDLAGIVAVPAPEGRVLISVDAALAGFSARALWLALVAEEPAIWLDDFFAETGRLKMDLRWAEAPAIEAALDTIARLARSGVPPAPWPFDPLGGTAERLARTGG